MTTLEHEFEERVFIHKSSLILASLLAYYKDINKTGVTIPEFLDLSPEEKAKMHYFKLLANKNEFNNIYEQCWNKYGELLP